MSAGRRLVEWCRTHRPDIKPAGQLDHALIGELLLEVLEEHCERTAAARAAPDSVEYGFDGPRLLRSNGPRPVRPEDAAAEDPVGYQLAMLIGHLQDVAAKAQAA